MTSRKSRKGFAFIMALVVIVCMAGLSLGYLYMTAGEAREAALNTNLLKAVMLAEAATEDAAKELLVACANYRTPPTSGTAAVDGREIGYTITQVGAQRVEVDDQGVQTIVQPYSIAASAECNGVTRRVEKIIDVEKTPIFQYVVFYHDDLEILPGPSMTLYGRIHSNRDIFLGSGGTLKVDSNSLRAAGRMHRYRKNDGTPSTGTVSIRVKGTGSYRSMESRTAFAPPSQYGFDSSFLGYDDDGDGQLDGPQDYEGWTLRSMSRWGGTVQTAEHGTTQIEPPSVQNIKRYAPTESGTGGDYTYDGDTGQYVAVAPGTGDYEKGYFHRNAALTIIDGRVYENGVEIVSWPDVTGDGVADSPISQKTFYDGRENKTVTTTDVNVDILGKSGHWPANGLLYAARTDSSAAQPNGIRLTNAAMFAAPLTVVSENPVYARGDYNAGDATHPKMPAAVITDSFNILSNAWNDAKTPGTLPTASNTTVNAAFITGAYSTSLGSYNGGFENLPRFHEKWDGKTCKIRGSFVNIYDSEQGMGEWVYGGDNYTAPARDWNYDTDFNDFNKLPPFTPSVVGTTRVVWISR